MRPCRRETVVGDPLLEAVMDGGLGTVLARQRFPLPAVARQPDQPVEDRTVVAPGTTGLLARLGDDEEGLQVCSEGIIDLPDGRIVFHGLIRRGSTIRLHAPILSLSG
jgi:hypothetical protein